MTPDDAAELVKQIRKLVGGADDRFFRHMVDRQVRIAARRVIGGWASREKLSRAIKDCTRALGSVKALGGVDTWDLDAELHDFIDLCRRTMRGAPVLSGGDRESPARKMVSAELAVELILNCGDRMPTVDLVSDVAAKLYELATGKAGGNVDEYASKLLKRMQEGGFPDARARRKLDRDGERAACDQLRENLKEYGRLWPTGKPLGVGSGEVGTVDLSEARPRRTD
jgi:hypothetical protein